MGCLEVLKLDLLLADHLKQSILRTSVSILCRRGDSKTYDVRLLLLLELLVKLAQARSSLVVRVCGPGLRRAHELRTGAERLR